MEYSEEDGEGGRKGGSKYVRGDTTAVSGQKAPKVTTHCCNDQERWEIAFVVSVSDRWQHVAGASTKWHSERIKNDFERSACKLAHVEKGAIVVNVIGHFVVKAAASIPMPAMGAVSPQENGTGLNRCCAAL